MPPSPARRDRLPRPSGPDTLHTSRAQYGRARSSIAGDPWSPSSPIGFTCTCRMHRSALLRIVSWITRFSRKGGREWVRIAYARGARRLSAARADTTQRRSVSDTVLRDWSDDVHLEGCNQHQGGVVLRQPHLRHPYELTRLCELVRESGACFLVW